MNKKTDETLSYLLFFPFKGIDFWHLEDYGFGAFINQSDIFHFIYERREKISILD